MIAFAYFVIGFIVFFGLFVAKDILGAIIESLRSSRQASRSERTAKTQAKPR